MKTGLGLLLWAWVPVVVAQTTIAPAARHAYTANSGWAAAGDPDRPRIDWSHGSFHSFAYGANVGWIRLGPGTLATASVTLPDTDGDLIADPWEQAHFGDLDTAGPATDRDHDGRSDSAEAIALTDPKDPADLLKLLSQTYHAAGPSVTLVFTSNGNRRYRIQHARDLTGSWTDTGLGVFEADPGVTTTSQVTVPAGVAGFFRVVALPPLFP